MEPTQKQFVRDCYDFYEKQGLEPGNPLHGEWQQAHYPKPKKMGRRWVWLLKEHHAIQSVLQSEEVNYPAVWSWERKYFVGEWAYLLPAFEKWLSEKGRIAGKASASSLSEEELSLKCRKAGRAGKGKLKRKGHRVGSSPASENQKAAARERLIALNESQYRCTVTGHVSNYTGLSRYQNNRNIDTSNRVKLTKEQ